MSKNKPKPEPKKKTPDTASCGRCKGLVVWTDPEPDKHAAIQTHLLIHISEDIAWMRGAQDLQIRAAALFPSIDKTAADVVE